MSVRVSRRELVLAALAALATPRLAMAEEVTGLAARPPLRPRLDTHALIARAALDGQVACSLIDPIGNAGMTDVQADIPMPPASTLKAITAIYALDRLGGAHRFRTRILRAGDMLILAGGGDPVLSSDDLAGLAAELVATGMPSPARFAVWGGALPQMNEIAPAQADHLAYNPSLSGMILNFNRVHLGWRRANGTLQLSLEARAQAHSPRAYTVTAAPGDQRDLFSYDGEGRLEAWTVSRAAMAQPGSRWLPVRRPELYAGDVFQTLCRAKGLVLPSPEVIETLPGAEELAARESPPLRDILADMLRFSTNVTAEAVGLHASQARNVASSAQAMQVWLQERGQGQGFHLRDHSGLDAESRVTARGMAAIMAGPGLAAGLPDLLKRDPLAGDLGRDPAFRAQVTAKTGTLNFVSNLAGYVGPPDQRHSFAILCADMPRQVATVGQELPSGVLNWTRRAKRLQRELTESWAVG